MKIIIFIASVLFCQGIFAGDLVLIGEGGFSRVDLDPSYQPAWYTEPTQKSIALGALAGYKFDSNIIVGNMANIYYEPNFLGNKDRIHVRDVSAIVGYSFDIYKRIRIVPMVGISFWKFEAKQGAFRNPGPEQRRESKDRNIVGKVNLEIPLNDFLAINTSYTYGRYDFGVLQSVRAGVKFQFL